MSRFEQLDAEILRVVGSDVSRFTGICTRVSDTAREAAKPDAWGFRNVGRLVDRRLQALRKAGRISYAKGHWRVMP